MEMIDWWTVPGRTWGVTNLEFKVEILPDPDGQPDDSAYHGDRDMELLESGDWGFTVVRVTPMTHDLTDHIEARQSIAGIEWGQLAERRVDREDLVEHPVRTLAEDAVIRLLRSGFTVETEEGSEFTPSKLLTPAPF